MRIGMTIGNLKKISIEIFQLSQNFFRSLLKSVIVNIAEGVSIRHLVRLPGPSLELIFTLQIIKILSTKV